MKSVRSVLRFSDADRIEGDNRPREDERLQRDVAFAMRSGLEEIPRSRLRFDKYMIEDEATGKLYAAVRGVVTDAQFTNATAFFFNERGLPVYLERPASGPRTRDELAEKRAAREQASATRRRPRIRR